MHRIRKALIDVHKVKRLFAPILGDSSDRQLRSNEPQLFSPPSPLTHNVECWTLLQQVVIAYERLQARYAVAQNALADVAHHRDGTVGHDRGELDRKDETIACLEKTVTDLKLLARRQRGALEEAYSEVDRLNARIDDFVEKMDGVTKSAHALELKPCKTPIDVARAPIDGLDRDRGRSDRHVARFKRRMEGLAAA